MNGDYIKKIIRLIDVPFVGSKSRYFSHWHVGAFGIQMFSFDIWKDICFLSWENNIEMQCMECACMNKL